MPYINQPSGSSGGHGNEIGYDQITASVSVVSTTEATGTTIISCAAHVFDGSPVIVEFFSPEVTSPFVVNTDDFTIVSLFEAATQIGRLASVESNPNGAFGISVGVPVCGRLRFTPTAASHTYTITAFASSTTGTPAVRAGASGTGANVPAYCRFTKV